MRKQLNISRSKAPIFSRLRSYSLICYIALIILFAEVVLYNYFWDIIVASKVVGINTPFAASVWDLGAYYQRLWAVLHVFSVRNIVYELTQTPIIFILSPLSLSKSPFFLVFTQTMWISLAVFPIYFIAFKKLHNNLTALLFSSTYLLYFGLAGVNWYDVHIQTLFIPLFLSGYSLYLFDKKKLAFIFFFLAGTVHFLFMIFPAAFYIFVLIEKKLLGKQPLINNRWLLFVAVFFSLFLVISIMYFYSLQGILGVASTTHISSLNFSQTFVANLDNKIQTFFIFLAPFLMLPLLSKRWALFMVPYFLLVFLSGSYIFLYPTVIILPPQDMLIPFIFLGTIDVLSEMPKSAHGQHPDYKSVSLVKTSFDNSSQKIAALIFIFIIFLGFVYEPYGPLNKYSVGDFQLSNELSSNETMFHAFNDIVAMLPTNNPYVIYQDNMPEVVIHDPVAISYYLGSYGYPNNFTYRLGGFYNKSVWTGNMEYILSDSNSNLFLQTGIGYQSSNMYLTLRHYLSMPSYGIEAEYNGLILVKKGYVGEPAFYMPMSSHFSSRQLYVTSWQNVNNTTGVISSSNLSGYQTLWYGPYTWMQPGKYILNLEVKASNISSSNSFLLRFSYEDNASSGKPIIMRLFNVNGSLFSMPNVWTNLTFTIETTNFLETVEFAGQSFNWAGNFSIREISLKQIYPPNSVE